MAIEYDWPIQNDSTQHTCFDFKPKTLSVNQAHLFVIAKVMTIKYHLCFAKAH